MPKTLLISPHARTFEDLLAPARLPELDLHVFTSAEEAEADCADAEIVFGAPDAVAWLLPRCSGLRWVQSSWAGVKPLIDATKRDYVLTGVKGIFGPLMGEYVMGWVLARQRNILVRAGRKHWDDTPDTPLAGRTLGIMGTGSIGAHVAATAASFGLAVRGLNTRGSAVAGFERCYSLAQRDEFFSGLDFLVALLPHTAATSGLVDSAAFARLNSGALFINAGRANTVVETDLLAALEGGSLGAAVLDVFDVEPLPQDSPLWSTEHLYVTSHTAAPTLPADIVSLFVDNYLRYVAGQPLQHVIDFERGY